MSDEQFKRACQIIGELTVENRRRFESQAILSEELRRVTNELPDGADLAPVNAVLAKHGI